MEEETMLIADSILDKDLHSRLLADLNHVCELANVPATFVHQSMKGVAEEADIKWVKGFNVARNSGKAGLIIMGHNPEVRMMAIAGALLRNFIDARILPLNTLLTLAEKGGAPEPSVLLVPNLFLRSAGKAIPAWKIQIIYDLLLHRLTSNKPSVLYVESMNALADAYGQVFADHLMAHYQISEV
jgi:hypothetical protein